MAAAARAGALRGWAALLPAAALAAQRAAPAAAPAAGAEAARHWEVNLALFLAVLAALSLTLALWWARGRRLEAQRTIIRTLFGLGEEILAAGSPAGLLQQVRAVLPGLLGVTGVRLYVHNRTAHTLEEVEGGSDSRPLSIPLDRPEGLIPSSAAACFRNQALLAVPDTRRSPFLRDKEEARQIRAVMLVPMLAQGEVRGVLEIHDARQTHPFGPDEQMMAQHLANQAAIALRLMEEQTVREQLSRTERLAAAAQLLSGVAGELRAPVEAIVRLTESFLYRRRGPVTEEEMRAIAVEAEKAAGILARLVSFSRPERREAKPVDLRDLLSNLIEFRRQEWALRGFDVHELLGHEPVWVLGSRGQLERVFLNLMVHAEQALADSAEKRLSISLSVLARRALVEISYTAAAPRPRAAEERSDTGVLIEGVVRGIIQSHGGETRLVRLPGAGSRMEVELPLAPERATARPGLLGENFTPRLATVLLIEPDGSARERLLALLSRRGYRVVPVGSAEQGVELVQRLRFDLVFCASQLPGLNWLELFQTIRRRIAAFVLVTQGYDPELAAGLPEGEIHLLPRPIVELELERLLLALESSVQPVSHARPAE